MEWIIHIVIGTVVGFIAGLLGVGGGFLLVPTLVMIGVPPHRAVGTSLACISLSSLASAYTHVRERRVLYRVVFLKEVFSIPSAVAGAYVSSYFSGKTLELVFSALLILLAFSLLRPEQEKVSEGSGIRYRNVPIVGIIAGFISGLLGVSGGVLNVPLFYTLVGLPIKYAVGTSSLSLFFTAAAGTFEHWRLGHVSVPMVLALSPGLVVGARLGAKTVALVSPGTLRRVFALLLVVMAIGMIT